MAFYYGISESSVSTLFSSLNTQSTSKSFTSDMSGLTSLISDYNSIRSGSYGRLLSAYTAKYGKDALSDAKSSTSTSTDSTKVIKNVKDSSEALKTTANALVKNASLYEKKEVEQEDGTKVSTYDMDAIYKNVSAFVEDYNATVDALDDSNSKNMVQTGINMLKNTGVYEKSLEDIGISIQENGKLKLDQDTLNSADVSKVKELFYGNSSFAYKTGVYAGKIENYAQMEAQKANTYTNTGNYAYNYSAGNLFNSMF